MTTWGAVTNQILALRDHLIGERVTLVVMEATSDYWKPFYYLLEDGPFVGSFALSEPIRQLRDLTRTRTTIHATAGIGRSNAWRSSSRTRHQAVVGRE